ncbi:MAG: DUF6236 family protein [Desulfuromonadaceae bacterium]|nr:DUF6236 family protein [Desulfuromonadaceae bacterium]MDD2848484.1 DUF6236 family protein [Desulfuromonadaceae bacterium]MDD4129887.1 DUF6236 family protein [Desulfuromonadaceae bacterium]
MFDNALYYPHINFKDTSWLKAMSLFYNRIYRIVPNTVGTKDCDEIIPLLETGYIGQSIDPIPYSKEASEIFLESLENWSAAALVCDVEEEKQLTLIHKDKTDYKIRELFSSLGYGQDENWVHVPTELASNYMLFLAKEIARRNNLQLITNDWAPWTGTTYFCLEGGLDECVAHDYAADYIDNPFFYYSLLLSEISPINISEIPSSEIVVFREKRKDEIENLRRAIYEVYSELQQIEDHSIRLDLIEDKIVEFKKAKINYQKSADIIKAKGWFGVSMMGFPAPIALGSLFNIPFASSVSLFASSLAIGGLFNISNTKEEIKKLQRDNPVSCLVEMGRDFKHYTSQRGGGAINYHAYNCMEEYVND